MEETRLTTYRSVSTVWLCSPEDPAGLHQWQPEGNLAYERRPTEVLIIACLRCGTYRLARDPAPVPETEQP